MGIQKKGNREMNTVATTHWVVTYKSYDMQKILARRKFLRRVSKTLAVIALVCTTLFALNSKSMQMETSSAITNTTEYVRISDTNYRIVEQSEVEESSTEEIEVVPFDNIMTRSKPPVPRNSDEVGVETHVVESSSTGTTVETVIENKDILVIEETQDSDTYELIPVNVSTVKVTNTTVPTETVLESPNTIAVKTLERLRHRNISGVTEEEFQVFCRIVESEVGGGRGGNAWNISDEELKECKRRVADCILNRIESKQFKYAKTISDVVFASNQFEPVSTGRYYEVKIHDLTVEVCREALAGSDMSDGALFFRSDGGKFTGKTLILIDGQETDAVGHAFFK